MSNELYAGLISGTSMDGIDVVLVDFAGAAPRVLAAETVPWSATLRERLYSAANGTFLTADQFAALDAAAGEAFADAALAVIPAQHLASLKAIGTHGQTLAHAPDSEPGYTLQIGDAARLAERSGVTVVADFRRRDIAAGGQGAPMVPAFHQAVFAEPGRTRVVLNVGGIANITCLPGDAAAVFGFDTGPANCLMDGWCRRHLGKPFDLGGRFAAQGTVDPELLAAMLGDPYFAAAPPKSTGTDYFSAAWLDRHLSGRTVAPADVQATLLALSATSIVDAIDARVSDCDEMLVCGGGAHNLLLMQALQQRMRCPVESTAAAGLDPDWVEGAAFAWLARQTLNGLPGNLPGVTGAAGPRILGAIYPA